MNLAELRQRVQAGEDFDYFLFYGHHPTPKISASCLSQWYRAPFLVDEIAYQTCEHYMMAAKARLFGDRAIEQKILQSPDPKLAKQLGRAVLRFDEQVWLQHRDEIVIAGNLAKFSQHPELRQFLLATGAKVLVEASPYDRIWGIGLSASHPLAKNPLRWQGQNLLGFALMSVRQKLV